MRDRFARVKVFVQNHRTSFVYSTGVVAGAAAMYVVFAKYGTAKVLVMATDPDLKKLLNESKDGFLIFPGDRAHVTLVSEEFVKKHA
jgi:hypothetical protein